MNITRHLTEQDYANWLNELRQNYRQCQIRASVKVNSEMLRFYWQLGKGIAQREKQSQWGEGFYEKLSRDLKATLSGAHSFTPRNLRYIKKFYLLYYKLYTFLPQLVANFKDEENFAESEGIFQVPWGHHRYIIDKCFESPEKAFFFIKKTVENGWSRSMLLNFLDTDLYDRQSNAITNFKNTLPAEDSELATQLTKDPYHFDFLTISESYKEKELKNALVSDITRFLMELGAGFAFMGKEYRVTIGNKELFYDLLFYNTHLHCYVVVELKVSEFEASYLGQLSSYISVADHTLRRTGDNRTIGLLICKTKDNVYARYALDGYNHPIGISSYEIRNPDIVKKLPSIADIEAGLLPPPSLRADKT